MVGAAEVAGAVSGDSVTSAVVDGDASVEVVTRGGSGSALSQPPGRARARDREPHIYGWRIEMSWGCLLVPTVFLALENPWHML